MPTWKITAPRNMGKVKEGTSFVVVSRTTNGYGPDATDVEEVLYTSGYKERGGSSAISYRSAGNWDCVKISDDTYPAWDEQHKKYQNEVKNDNGAARKADEDIARETRKPSKNDGGGSNSSSQSSDRSSSSTSSEDNGSCVKFIFTIIPVLPIWWLIKLFIKAGAAIFVLIWWLIKAIFYIISWPIRILLYCCLDKEKRRFLPKWTFDIIPAYSFKKF